MTNNLIHVNAYTKSDGTHVKEHWRGSGTDNTILTGRVSETIDRPGSFGEALATILDVAVPIAASAVIITVKLYIESQNAAAANFENIAQYKSQLTASIKTIDLTQNTLKTSINKTVNELAKTKNQEEYSRLHETLQQQNTLYNKNHQTINKIKTANHNNDYKNVIQELENYRGNFESIVVENSAKNPLNITNNWNNNLHAPYGSVPVPGFPVVQKGAIDGAMFGLNTIALGRLSDAKELWKAASHDFQFSSDYITKNGKLVASVSQLPSIELQQTVSGKLQGQLGVNDTMGVIFNPDSALSQTIANSSEFKEHVAKNLNALLKGEVIKDASTQFRRGNLFLALKNVDILNTMLDENGNLYSIVFDTYDFNPGENIFIQQARDVQEAGLIRNYYILAVIFIPKEQLEQLLRFCF